MEQTMTQELIDTRHIPLVVFLADSTLILGQRNAEWTGHGPALEQDIAITNIALDLIGQARNLYAHAASLYNEADAAGKAALDPLLPRPWKQYGRQLQEDDLALLRDERQYRNLLLCELPRGDWAFTTLRQFFFSAWQLPFFQQLKHSADTQLRAIAEKSVKEITYHLRWSSEWVIRLGDGTEESKRRISQALAALWPYTGEMFTVTPMEQEATAAGTAINLAAVKEQWQQTTDRVFAEAGLQLPSAKAFQNGGKQGIHTEHMGYLLADMQYLQRTYPNLTW